MLIRYANGKPFMVEEIYKGFVIKVEKAAWSPAKVEWFVSRDGKSMMSGCSTCADALDHIISDIKVRVDNMLVNSPGLGKEFKPWSKMDRDEKLKIIRIQYGNPHVLKEPGRYVFSKKKNKKVPKYGGAPLVCEETGRENEMNTETKTHEIIDGLCGDMESFTSLDVSNQAKQDGLVTRHREVAHLVRTAYANGKMDNHGYIRTTINVTLKNGKSVPAFLYHHLTTDPNEYDNGKRSQKALPPPKADGGPQSKPAPAAAPAAPAPAPTAAPVQQLFITSSSSTPSTRVLNVASRTCTRIQKGDGRLEIPGVWISRLGWTEGTKVRAVREANGIRLDKADQFVDAATIRLFTVDRWGRIRLTTKAMEAAGINFGTGGRHDLTLSYDDTILVQ